MAYVPVLTGANANFVPARGKKYKRDSTGQYVEIANYSDATSDELVFSGGGSDFRKDELEDRNLSVIDNRARSLESDLSTLLTSLTNSYNTSATNIGNVTV